MCLLMAFNKREEWTYEELLGETGFVKLNKI